MLDFSWMSTSQIAALISGIALTVISIATTLLAFKYAKKINSFIKVMAMSLVSPFLAMTAWLFLILSFLDGFRKDEFLSIVISALIALFICAMIMIVAKALYAKHREALDKKESEEDAIEGSFVDQTNAIAPSEEAALIENKEEIANEAEENKEAAVEETPTETEEVEEKTEETDEVPAEENAEDTTEESEEQPAEIEETEEFKDVDDEDFEKFLESLKANNDDKKDEE